MPVIAPFCGIRYNPAQAGDLNKVITQPYDKITPQMQEGYYRGSEYNFSRLILNRDANPYLTSKTTLEQWLAQGIMIRDPRPAIYPYRQLFEIGGRRKVRRGLICACRLEPFESGVVLPHERTLSKPKEDRLNLMRTTKKQFEQVFMLYADDQDRVNKVLAPIWKWTPEVEVTDEYDTTHCLWSVSDPKTIHAIQSALRPKTFVIADGHHRYETALNYRSEILKKTPNATGKEAFNYRLVTCVNLNDPALVILPTHRMVANLTNFNLNDLLSASRAWFDITKVKTEEVARHVGLPGRRVTGPAHSFVLFAGPEKAYTLSLRPDSGYASLFPPERSTDYRDLDVAVLHTVFIEKLLGIKPEVIEDYISYERDWKNALTKVEGGSFQLALLVHPTRPEQVERIAENRERMPQKSTDFYPKLISGLVFMDVEEAQTVG